MITQSRLLQEEVKLSKWSQNKMVNQWSCLKPKLGMTRTENSWHCCLDKKLTWLRMVKYIYRYIQHDFLLRQGKSVWDLLIKRTYQDIGRGRVSWSLKPSVWKIMNQTRTKVHYWLFVDILIIWAADKPQQM